MRHPRTVYRSKAGALMIAQFSQIISTPLGGLLVLALAAYLEVQGDACFQTGLYHSSGAKQIGWLVSGAIVLVCYSLFLNSSKIDSGKLLGIYVVLFFLVAQMVAKLPFSSIAQQTDISWRSLRGGWRPDHDTLEGIAITD